MATENKNTNQKDILHRLIGGIIGIFLGFIISMDIVFNLGLPSQEVYEAVFHVCMIMIVLSMFFGAVVGIVIGKIIFFLKSIYKPKHKR